jgi:NMD protein affecting ribosome stability and mRNA decay
MSEYRPCIKCHEPTLETASGLCKVCRRKRCEICKALFLPPRRELRYCPPCNDRVKQRERMKRRAGIGILDAPALI